MNQFIRLLSNKSFFRFTRQVDHIPTLREFMSGQLNTETLQQSNGKKYYIETYGCQMNENDSQIISSILHQRGYQQTREQSDAEILLLNTCAIRANAENKVLTRLAMLNSLKKQKPELIVGVLGCMAERLKSSLIDQGADLVAGPDSYRNLPNLLESPDIDVAFQDETYEDFKPMLPEGTKSAFVSIMRGCNNMCSFCIVPFTRGRERSRPPQTILDEIRESQQQGVREITLLGQNVNSYFFRDESTESQHHNAEGFKELYKLREGNGVRFHQLLDLVAQNAPEMRIRFTSPHPKDFSPQVIDVINRYPNISKSIHIPAQSGSSSMLSRMRRNYTREALIQLCKDIRAKIPGITLSTDIIVGFCDETEQEFQDTLSLMDEAKFEQAFMFAYSMRERTHAHRNFKDSVPEEIKQQRLKTLIERAHVHMKQSNQDEVGRYHLVMIDTDGKKEGQLKGRTDTNKTVILQNTPISSFELSRSEDYKNLDEKQLINKGDYVIVQIQSASLKTLIARPITKSSIQHFNQLSGNKPFLNILSIK